MAREHTTGGAVHGGLIWPILGLLLSAALVAVVARFVMAQGNGAVRRKTVVLEMSWKRGDNHYGPNFVSLESPCLNSAVQGCSCVQDFRITTSKEFADYVGSFGDAKVPVKYRVDYDRRDEVVGAILEAVGEWPQERLHTNESSLAITFRISAHRPAGGHFRSPADCFPKPAN